MYVVVCITGVGPVESFWTKLQGPCLELLWYSGTSGIDTLTLWIKWAIGFTGIIV